MRVFSWLLLGLAFGVSAADRPVTFDLHEVETAILTRVVLEDVAGASVIVAPEVFEDKRPVSFVLKKATPDFAVKQLAVVLGMRGFDLRLVDGVYRVSRKAEEGTEVVVYRPKYRSVSYLTDLLGGVLPRSAIANQRMVANGLQDGVQQSGVLQQQAGQQRQDTGTSAYSQIDKTEKDAIVIKAKPEEVAQAMAVLRQVDRPIPELLVKAVLLEVQTGETDASAVDLVAAIVGKGIGSLSIGWKGGADPTAGVRVNVAGIDAVWSALSTDKRFKIISSPQVRVKSGGTAKLTVGSDTPVLGAIQYQGNGQSQQSIEYKSSGVILELSPQVRGEQAELRISQQLSSFAKTETGVNDSPTLMKREVNSTVMVGPKDVILLGGLDQERDNATGYGLFFMPKWMRSSRTESERNEIVLVLHVERLAVPES